MIIINYGGGTNSTALIIEAVKRGLLPPGTIIIFADTGSERPGTYVYLVCFMLWLALHGLELTVVRWIRRDGRHTPLHEDCEEKKTLPSRAFGFSGCTTKWKQQPVDKFLEQHPAVAAEHAAGRRVERWIGYDADELRRVANMNAKNPSAHLWSWRAPLFEWDMGRAECVEIIERAGLPLPGKSACWLCPSSTKSDIEELGRSHPDLLARALRIEQDAIASGNVRSRGGLGGRLNWASFVESTNKRLPMAPGPQDEFDAVADGIACGCYDG